jgi:hypothetical protein
LKADSACAAARRISAVMWMHTCARAHRLAFAQGRIGGAADRRAGHAAGQRRGIAMMARRWLWWQRGVEVAIWVQPGMYKVGQGTPVASASASPSPIAPTCSQSLALAASWTMVACQVTSKPLGMLASVRPTRVLARLSRRPYKTNTFGPPAFGAACAERQLHQPARRCAATLSLALHQLGSDSSERRLAS